MKNITNPYNDDATNERLSKAKAAGLAHLLSDIPLDNGKPSSQKRRIIEHPLDTALRRCWISEHQKRAGDKFRYHAMGAYSQLQFARVSSYIRIDKDRYPDYFAEKSANHSQVLHQALQVIRANVREPFLDWIMRNEYTDSSVNDFGACFTPLRHKEARKAIGIVFLNLILTDLAKHFGFIE